MKFSIISVRYGVNGAIVFQNYEDAIKKFNYGFEYHSSWRQEVCFIDFKDLEDFVKFQKEIKNELIFIDYQDNCFEIYDSYRE